DPAMLEPGRVPPVEIVAPADDHLGPPTVRYPARQASVGQGRSGGVEDQELLRLATVDRAGHDPVLGGIELDGRIEVAPPTAGDPVVARGPGVEEDGRAPSVGRDLGGR